MLQLPPFIFLLLTTFLIHLIQTKRNIGAYSTHMINVLLFVIFKLLNLSLNTINVSLASSSDYNDSCDEYNSDLK